MCMCMLILALVAYSQLAQALVGFDCKSSQSKVATFSALEVQQCQEEEFKATTTKPIKAAIVLHKRVVDVTVNVCSLEIEAFTLYCGKWGHIALQPKPFKTFRYDFTESECHDLIANGQMRYPFNTDIIVKSAKNNVLLQSIDVAGSVDYNSDCTGENRRVDGVMLNKAFITHKIKLYFDNKKAKLDVRTDTIVINGVTCAYSNSKCTDYVLGQVFWTIEPNIQCRPNNFVKIYNGNATLISLTTKETGAKQNIVSVHQDPYVFAIKQMGSTTICRQSFFLTDQENIYIVPENFFYHVEYEEITSESGASLSLISYINTKFLFLEFHVADQIEALYKTLSLQQCENRRIALRNLLSLAYVAPDQFAYEVQNEPGFAGVVAGEQIHIIKCLPVNVTFRQENRCYNDLPVTYKNTSMFLTPRNRILTEHATEIPCDQVYTVTYNFSNTWTSVHGKPQMTIQPQALNPNIHNSWYFHHISSIGSSGLYTQDQIESLTRQMLLSSEREAIANTIVNTVQFDPSGKQGVSLGSLIDTSVMDKIESSFQYYIWGNLQVFGSMCSGFIGMYIIAKMVTSAFNTIGRGCLLFRIVGWSFQLLAACFQSSFLYVALRKPKRNSEEISQATLQTYTAIGIPPTSQEHPQDRDTAKEGTSATESIPQKVNKSEQMKFRM